MTEHRLSNRPPSPIELQVMWNRLIAVVEEQAQVLLRTAFGMIVREAGDISAGAYDLKGRMIAQAVTGTPGHVNTMAMAVGHFLERFPAETMKPGDVYLTNDPWLGTGHLFDIVVVTPAFRGGKLVALLASTCHVIDIGGIGFSADARSVFEEGLYIPHLKLASEGVLNQTLLDMLEWNVREPIQVKGDLMGLVGCNEAGCGQLVHMMDEFRIDSIEPLADHIIDTSRQGMLEAIRRLPAGTYCSTMTTDGYEHPIDLVMAMTVSNDGIHVDFTGSSPASGHGINSPFCYTEAYTSYGIKCLVAPKVPNNAGSLEPITFSAPPGSIVNPERPSAVAARHVIGQMLPDAIFGCLHQAVASGAPAEGAGSMWAISMLSGHYAGDANPGELAGTRRFTLISVGVGGVGGRPTKDGLSATGFPSGISAVPVELTESISPLVFWRREMRPDSGGAGKYRGGHGQIIEIGNTEKAPFAVLAATFDRFKHAARGREGGKEGALARMHLRSGKVFSTKSAHTTPPGDSIIMETPGGGGFGNPFEREPERVAAEVLAELVSVEAAKRDYGVAVAADGRIDAGETSRLRKER